MDDEFRFRSRTEAELLPRERGLVELVGVLESLGAPYFLADGTLLGTARDGDFIPWDDDTGLCMKAEDFVIYKSRIAHRLESSGFSVKFGHRRNPKLNSFKYGEKFELTAWKLRGSRRVRWGLQFPAYLLNNPGQIELRGRQYPCPNPYEDYLIFRYGEDWRTPKVGRGTHALNSKTQWSLIKRRLRQQSPGWLLKIFGKL